MKRAISILLVLVAAATCFTFGEGLWSVAMAAAPETVNVGPRANSASDQANGIYVSPSGNDAAATGAVAAPYKSINAALAAASPGDTIILRSGTYREGQSVRVRIPNITIKSAKGEWAVIDLTVQAPGDENSGVIFDVESSGGKLQCVEVKGGYYAVCIETKWDWGDPSDVAGASNILIEDCKLHDSKYDVVKVKPNCNNVTIRFNEIYNSGKAFVNSIKNGEDNAEGIDNVNGANMKVQNNYIHDICSNGVYAKGGATDALIENNRIETAYGGGILVGFDTSPEFFDTATNPRYYENIRGIVRNNLIIGTGWEGIGFYGSKDAQVYNNTLVNVANYGEYHSAIYFGLTYQDWEDHPGRPASVNPNIHHNIVSEPSSIVRPMIEIRYANELGGMSALEGNPTMSSNCYYIAGKSAAFVDTRPRSEMESAGLAAWQSHISGDAGSIEADPALDANYMPTNPKCAGMGVTSAPSVGGSNGGSNGGNGSGVAKPSVANFVKANTYRTAMFADVDENAWYGNNVQKVVATAYEYGLMQGDGGKFNPTGDMTIAQAVTIAARVRSIYNGEGGEFVQGSTWYQVYVDYAIANQIIDAGAFGNYGKSATRAEMAYIFSRALPEAEFAAVKTVNSLPDVDSGTRYSAAIFMLYRAGVLTGSDDAGTFNPGKSINRAEAAAIISRVILPSSRAAN